MLFQRFGVVCASRTTAVSKCDLISSTDSCFERPERIFDQTIQHSTSLDAKAQIQTSGFIRGSRDSLSVYDGLIGLDREAPVCAYFQLTPESEGLIFPFSQYPQRVESGTRTAMVTCPIDQLNADEFKLFYVTSTLTQFGKIRSSRVHTHVVFARENSWEFCAAKLIELDKENNSVIWRDRSKGFVLFRNLLASLSRT